MRGRSTSPEDALRWRGVEDPCESCHGSGVVSYCNTSTWRGGMGASAITNDVCDQCWGSGDKHRHWTDLRALRASYDADVARDASTLLARRLGASMASMHAAIEALCAVLDREARRRKPPVGDTAIDRMTWEVVCHGLSRTLRDMIGRQR